MSQSASEPAATTERDQRIIRPTGRVRTYTAGPLLRVKVKEEPLTSILYEQVEVQRVCVEIFLNQKNVQETGEIVQKILQRTNVEIVVKHHSSMMSATFKDTNAIVLRALIGVLTLSTAMTTYQPMSFLIVPFPEQDM